MMPGHIEEGMLAGLVHAEQLLADMERKLVAERQRRKEAERQCRQLLAATTPKQPSQTPQTQPLVFGVQDLHEMAQGAALMQGFWRAKQARNRYVKMLREILLDIDPELDPLPAPTPLNPPSQGPKNAPPHLLHTPENLALFADAGPAPGGTTYHNMADKDGSSIVVAEGELHVHINSGADADADADDGGSEEKTRERKQSVLKDQLHVVKIRCLQLQRELQETKEKLLVAEMEAEGLRAGNVKMEDLVQMRTELEYQRSTRAILLQFINSLPSDIVESSLFPEPIRHLLHPPIGYKTPPDAPYTSPDEHTFRPTHTQASLDMGNRNLGFGDSRNHENYNRVDGSNVQLLDMDPLTYEQIIDAGFALPRGFVPPSGQLLDPSLPASLAEEAGMYVRPRVSNASTRSLPCSDDTMVHSDVDLELIDHEVYERARLLKAETKATKGRNLRKGLVQSGTGGGHMQAAPRGVSEYQFNYAKDTPVMLIPNEVLGDSNKVDISQRQYPLATSVDMTTVFTVLPLIREPTTEASHMGKSAT